MSQRQTFKVNKKDGHRPETPLIEKIVSRDKFRDRIEGEATDLYFLKNGNGMQVAITNFGGRIVSLIVPGKNYEFTDVVIGLDSLQNYQLSTEPYFGAIIGRYANRIDSGRFILDGNEYILNCNNPPNTLHGGNKGFQNVVWRVVKSTTSELELAYLSRHMEEGYPGNLETQVSYKLTSKNELIISYHATSDMKTIVNLSSHAFFNLNGAGSGTINNHQLLIYADYYLPVNDSLIPLGDISSVAGTPFDFHRLTRIGARLDEGNDQIQKANGYDHTFIINGYGSGVQNKAALVIGDQTGIVMEVLTTEPGMQFYGGNSMQSKNQIRGGGKDDFRTAFCLETQHYPDAPNQSSFPSTALEAGESYTSNTVYRFLSIK